MFFDYSWEEGCHRLPGMVCIVKKMTVMHENLKTTGLGCSRGKSVSGTDGKFTLGFLPTTASISGNHEQMKNSITKLKHERKH